MPELGRTTKTRPYQRAVTHGDITGEEMGTLAAAAAVATAVRP